MSERRATPHRRVVLVTGASSGIGLATAAAFAARGDRTHGSVRDDAALREAAPAAVPARFDVTGIG